MRSVHRARSLGPNSQFGPVDRGSRCLAAGRRRLTDDRCGGASLPDDAGRRRHGPAPNWQRRAHRAVDGCRVHPGAASTDGDRQFERWLIALTDDWECRRAIGHTGLPRSLMAQIKTTGWQRAVADCRVARTPGGATSRSGIPLSWHRLRPRQARGDQRCAETGNREDGHSHLLHGVTGCACLGSPSARPVPGTR
jgi:hypothetical protein